MYMKNVERKIRKRKESAERFLEDLLTNHSRLLEREDLKDADMPEGGDLVFEISQAEALISSIAVFTAVRTAGNFRTMVSEMSSGKVEDMLAMIGCASPDDAVLILKGMFFACGMDHAAEALDIIEVCGYCSEDVYEEFITYFMHADGIGYFPDIDDIEEDL